jgi:putative membrane protein
MLEGLAPVVGATLAVLYLTAVRRRARAWSRWRTASALLGLLLVTAGLSGPLAARHDLPAHMVQHLLVGMYGPLALALGAPLTLLLSVSPLRARPPVRTVLRSRAVHVLSHPATAALLSVGGLYVLYLTPLYAHAMHTEAVHVLVHLHVLATGYLLAWSVAGPDPAPRRPGTGVRVAVLVAAGGAHAFLAQLLYSRAPRWPVDGMQSADEVRQAAQWMYYGGHVDELLLLTALFAAWYRRRSPRPAAAARVAVPQT